MEQKQFFTGTFTCQNYKNSQNSLKIESCKFALKQGLVYGEVRDIVEIYPQHEDKNIIDDGYIILFDCEDSSFQYGLENNIFTFYASATETHGILFQNYKFSERNS
jgi:hypothetical protein